MTDQEQKCCMGGIKKHWKWIVIKLLLIVVWIIIGVAISCHRGERKGYSHQCCGMYEGHTTKGMMFDKKGYDKEDYSEEDIAAIKEKKAELEPQMQEMAALKEDYASMRKLIMRGDTDNASARIELVIKELAELKADLPNLTTIFNK